MTRLDWGPVSAWLCGLGIGLDGELRFERIGNGQSNLTYRVCDARGRSVVLRRPPLGCVLQSAHDVAREGRILRGLDGTGVLTPKILASAAAGEVMDSDIVVMELVAGQTYDTSEKVAGIPLDERSTVCRSFIEAVVTIHEVDLGRAGLAEVSGPAGLAERQLRRWKRQWEDTGDGQLPLIAELHAELSARVPAENERTLVHGDLHLGNVLVSEQDWRLSAVLDWELCTLGDPIADLGTALAYWERPGEQPVLGVTAPSAMEGMLDRAQFAKHYAEVSGRDLRNLGFWYALACWKIAIIYQGVLRRARSQNIPNRQGIGPSNESVMLYVEKAAKALDDGESGWA